ncbi:MULTISPECIES: hypothetical protein [Escherichia]|uniref:Uncharacterized protein n=1 Tax=Escherichia whittamii TaxID=2762229 RepID=A0ABR8TAQ8_9ESCH|nr:MULTISPECIES: hypothetical protein [Escherichia]EEZ4380677.1 hypothetical protein [Escherichia coli]MBD7972807.1 hypothetical protein [Escherichia whittamii]MCA4890426.1 hypothetical protein [Escherichia whittamii]MEB7936225.1 hypothetical protein [Escherichia whittamii]MEC9494404.1 hypothetical protein [Escherichia whittamii]
MSLTDTLKNALSALTEGGLNRYRLDIPSCGALLDVETFSGKALLKLRNFRLPDSIFSTAKVAVTDPVASTNSDAAEVNL